MWYLLALTLLLGATPAAAQQDAPVPIQDNSFLVEEAYNQERGVVQHVSTFSRAAGAGEWTYTFTQEWPVGGRRHQLSYTLPVSRLAADGQNRTGLGDLGLNYRYQLGSAESSIAFAPRATLLLPTGATRWGLGAGGAGAQVNLPLSVVLPASLVAHTNAGATYTPSARDALGNRASAVDYSLGQSVVWLAHPKLNLLLEAVWSRTEDVIGPGRTGPSTELLLAPGVRGAIDLASGLQIVPGLAFPVGVGPSRGDRSVFAYLSFEHSFAKPTPRP
jgi:hypothetical protein